MPYRFKTARHAVTFVVALAVVGWGAPAAQAAEVPFTNWTVKGNLTVAKLKQDVVLPPVERLSTVRSRPRPSS